MTDELDLLRLARADGVGPVTFRRLLGRYRTAADALAALPELARAGGRAAPPPVPDRAEAAREMEQIRRLGGRLLFFGQAGYPPLLALLDDAPPVLAVLGDPAALSVRAVALVGSRNASANGQRFAETLAQQLAVAGVAVVSGLARGIDAAAHQGALQSGRTIACVAGGIDVPYPPEHADLQARIAAEGGAVVAEMPPGMQPLARHFPRRNRIIAGLSLGVVVIEAALRSGSLITARLAHDAGRELFAVPGSPLDPRNRGSNDLLRQGAHMTESAADVLDNLPDHPHRAGLSRSPLFARGPAPTGMEEPFPPILLAADPDPGELDRARLGLLDLLGPAPTELDELVRRTGLSTASVMAALLEMELAGRVETLPGNRVALLSDPDARN